MDTLKVWDVEAGEEDGHMQLVHAATVMTDDDEVQVSDMAVSEGMLATIWRNGWVRLYNMCDTEHPLDCLFSLKPTYIDRGMRADLSSCHNGVVALSGSVLAFMVTSWHLMDPEEEEEEYDDEDEEAAQQPQLNVEHMHMIYLSTELSGYSASKVQSLEATHLGDLKPVEPLGSEGRKKWYQSVQRECRWLGLHGEDLAVRSGDTGEVRIHTTHHRGW